MCCDTEGRPILELARGYAERYGINYLDPESGNLVRVLKD